MNELREGQRVQLTLSTMMRERRDVYAGYSRGVVAGFHGERIWVKFDGGWRALFSATEIEPAVEQIGMFGEVQG